MLGQRIAARLKRNEKIELLCAGIEINPVLQDIFYEKADLTDKKSVRELIKSFYPDIIINCAAFTDVDGAEKEKDAAWKINVTSVENLVKYGKTKDAHLIHFSTDYIFNGENGPYNEEDLPDPLSYYGRSKLAAENVITLGGIKYTIIRTNVLYGALRNGRPDFVTWVYESLRMGKEIKIVDDQINNPAYADDIVDAVSKIVDFDKTGIYNIGGPEFISRYEFTLRIANYFGLDKKLISPVKTEIFNQPAKRPLKSGLITLKAETEFGFRAHTIEETFQLMQREYGL